MNNEQIDNTSYYTLPSGRQLEDFIAEHGLKFAEGSALKYLWRAGKKDGESAEKDRAKVEHFIHFIARQGCVDDVVVRHHIENLVRLAECDYEGELFLSHKVLLHIGKHYHNAVKKHPYFCDGLLPTDVPNPMTRDAMMRELHENLSANRKRLERGINMGNVMWNEVLNCEVWEITEALANGDTEHAVDECYDAIAVLLRVIDVLENRQPLGKPKEKKD